MRISIFFSSVMLEAKTNEIQKNTIQTCATKELHERQEHIITIKLFQHESRSEWQLLEKYNVLFLNLNKYLQQCTFHVSSICILITDV